MHIQSRLASRTRLMVATTAIVFLGLIPSARAQQNQTATLSPIVIDGDLPYEINVVVRNMGTATIPTL